MHKQAIQRLLPDMAMYEIGPLPYYISTNNLLNDHLVATEVPFGVSIVGIRSDFLCIWPFNIVAVRGMINHWWPRGQ
jgi:hypothetical protein